MKEERTEGQLAVAQPAEEIPAAPKKRRLKRLLKGKKRKCLALLVAAAIVAGILAARGFGGQEAAAEASYQTATVETRNITRSLSSSGTLQPADSYTVSTLVSGEILSDTFEEGDQVEKGQLLYTLDSSGASNSQTQAQNSYTQAQTNYQQAVAAKYPTADLSGTVSEVYVKNGDTVSAGTELMRIVGDNHIYLTGLFPYASPSDFYIGQTATIYINGFAGTTTGTVTAVSTSTFTTSSGQQAVSVQVKASNPGLVTSDYTATIYVGSYASYGQTSINLGTSSVVTAEASGKISGLSWLAGDTISEGDRICTITGNSVDNSIQNAEINVENAQSSLENAKETLDDYSITAPISGEVVTKNAKAGDKIEGGSDGTLCVIYDLSYLEMTMNIDELDISDVAVGQEVQITADAVEGTTYTGVVTKVSVAGTTSGGITTYPVTVRIDETDGLRPGMNVDAEIILDSAEDVLAIPSGAVNRGNTVLITADSPSAANALDQEAPEGYVYVEVETGISDDSYIQILSGLQEGDTVAYLQTSGGSGDMAMGAMGMMPSGGMGGGMNGGPVAGGGGMSGGPGGGF
ncbi:MULTISPECIES: HlyD family efflux transporter periplasmic adaptor subunit [environmental samples]|uniref:HlyD family efflux transporter periplasmic adaptor subunit n=1 Tax=environmental samples TaxID=876090 RepID=UPI000340EC5D|nr:MULTISPECIES: HlyD family efflux transporter periplasmic adaptor subunit [environmental samples]CDC69427.1 putative drug efflux protein [Oscillibacter sp. CAG:155]